MWIVIKLNKNKLNFFKQDFKKKFKNECVVYYPTVLGQKFYKNKIIKKKLNLLGDYIFCYSKSFSNLKILNVLKYTKGCKYILSNSINSQNEINNFIDTLKGFENNEGYISESFYLIKEKLKYRFKSGPFTDQIFEILRIQKNNFEILLNNFKISLKKKDFLFEPK